MSGISAGQNLSPDEIGLLFASSWVLSDIEPRLDNVADRKAVLFNEPAEYAYTHVNINALSFCVFRKAEFLWDGRIRRSTYK